MGTRQQPRGQAQPQNSKLQALINSYTAPLQTQLAYAGSLGKNGFNRSHLGAAGNLGSQGAQRSSIGQEGQFWQNQSDPEPRDATRARATARDRAALAACLSASVMPDEP